ncbi:MAG: hypothetical protein MUO17_03145 [Dehalococcoidales bacterium]|nr:hypothetical protein [Dehalococcoidales bacterium]
MKVKGWYWLFGVFLAILIFLVVFAYCKGYDWPILFTPIALVLAGAIAYQQLEHARHARCAGLLLDIMKQWNSKEMAESRQLLWEMKNPKDEILKLYKAKDENFIKVLKVAEFGESLGVLVLCGYIETKDVWLVFEYDWKERYQYFSGLLEELKKKNPSDTTFCNLKFLYEELDKISR